MERQSDFANTRMQSAGSTNHIQALPEAEEDEPVAFAASAHPQLLTIAAVATFTADDLKTPLLFWMNSLGIPSDIVMSPYGQVIQQMLDPNSRFARNEKGVNVLLIRLEDWLPRDRSHDHLESHLEQLRRAVAEFLDAMTNFRARSSSTLQLFVCPVSAALPAVYSQRVAKIQNYMVERLAAVNNLVVCSHEQLTRLYPVDEYENPLTERIGHIPYTPGYFTAIATFMARRIAVQVKPPYKVIAVDCDNTLWAGIVGEDTVAGLHFSPHHLRLQELLVRQQNAGMLVCLCSKNSRQDVEAVFAQRPEMILKWEHVIAERINWQPKWRNLESLAAELGLALDSFIFIDDNALECAEVAARCPSVLTLQVPPEPADYAHFLDHVWAFDRTGVTEEAQARTTQYRANRARSTALAEAPSLEEFLASLDLTVDVAAMRAEDLPRVAELVQRTNQFNLTGIRRRAAEIESLHRMESLLVWVVRVRDRFGDYGLTGALFLRYEPTSIDVDTFVLSCRVLGRGVERKIVNALGRVARSRGAPTVVFRFRETSRNEPARTFLESAFQQFEISPDTSTDGPLQERLFVVPAAYAQDWAAQLAAAKWLTQVSTELSGNEHPLKSIATPQWHATAYRLSRVADILREMGASRASSRNGTAAYVSPRTSAERTVADIWAEILGAKVVGVHDDFLDLGGDSLLAVQVISRLSSALSIDLSLHEFFEQPTVEGIATRLTDARTAAPAIVRTESAEPAPLSSAQRRLWFIDRLEGGSTAYHISQATRLRGRLDQGALEAAISSLIERHEALRTVFTEVTGDPRQVVRSSTSFTLKQVDLSDLREPEQKSEVLRHEREEALAPFDLSSGPLMRGRLLRLSSDEHLLVIAVHHIVSDGWSMGVLHRELGALYSAHCARGTPGLTPLPLQFVDYARWQHEWSAGAAAQQQVDYWKAQLLGSPEMLTLPTDRPRPMTLSYRGANENVAFGKLLTSEIKDFSRRFNVTVAMILCAAWFIVLERLSGQEDIVIGMPVANRRRTELESLIGFFANTVAIRFRKPVNPTVVTLLQYVKERMLDAYTYQETPFDQIVEALHPVRSLGYSPVFQVMFVFQNAPREVLKLTGLSLTTEEVAVETAQFDLLLSLQEDAGEISGYLNYATDLFDRATIASWLGYLKTVLTEMLGDPLRSVDRIQIMNDGEYRWVVEHINETHVDFPRHSLVHELFEAEVERVPEAVAVVSKANTLTYMELNLRANRLARHLRQSGVLPDSLVAICLDRDVSMVVGLLGILKAGGAYVPLDPAYPPNRLRQMLEDASPALVLTQDSLKGTLPIAAAEVISLDTALEAVAARTAEDLIAEGVGANSQNLVYGIFTSGSTGRPKGTAMSHRSMVNLLNWHMNSFGRATGLRVSQFAALSFDVAFQEIFSTLCTGGTLVLVDDWVRRDAYSLEEFLARNLIERLFVPPMMLQSLAEAGRREPLLRNALRDIIVAGDQLRITPHTAQFFEQLPDCQLHNHYGPTESHVVTALTLAGSPDQWTELPAIGRPVQNAQIYVLDQWQQPVPVGVLGEIYIGGDQVARGYVGRPDLTAERFIADPFAAMGSARLYRTGDLARWNRDGLLEYVGRSDDQVKIRGFRIELSEIESQLRRHPQVDQAAVIAREYGTGEKRLVAYITVNELERVTAEQLRAHMQAAVPEHMVPSAFVVLPQLPLSPNGKLDRRALPAPGLDAYTVGKYEAPRGEIECVLATIWQKLLKVERVGRGDNFFELGGHSMLIVQMLEQLRRVGIAVEVRRVFESPILADLAQSLLSGAAPQFEPPPSLIPAGCEVITASMLPMVKLEDEHIRWITRCVAGGAANIQDIYPLAPLQEGILFHHLLNEERGDPYTRPMLLSLASQERVALLIVALQQVIDRHDILRTAVLFKQLPTTVQVVYRQAALPVETISLQPDRDALEQLEELMQPQNQRLDLQQAPLMRLRVAANPQGPGYFALLQTHHLVCDNEAIDLLISEVMACFDGQADTLPPASQYRIHVAQTLARAESRDSESYFRSRLADVEEPTAPFGLLDVHGDGGRIAIRTGMLESELAARVRVHARRAAISAATLFHAAWGLVVARTSAKDDIVFGSVLLGRMQGSAGSKRILGMFINTLPLRLHLKGTTAAGLIEQTQRELIELLSHEQSSLATARRASGVAGSMPLFSALLNYRHSTHEREQQRRNVEGVASAAGLKLLSIKGWTNYPIVMEVVDLGEEFGLEMDIDRRIDPDRVLRYLTTALLSLLDALESCPQTPALALSVLPEQERGEVVHHFNATQHHFRDRVIHEVFAERAQSSPDNPAVVYEGRSLTYAQLDARASRLARHLREKGVVAADQVVGLCLERGLEMFVAVLGILKAGAAYLPLDAAYPPERLAYMVADAGLKWVVVQERMQDRLSRGSVELIDMDQVQLAGGRLEVSGADTEPVCQTSSQLAYVIYTSGSTGQPKGVMVEHRNVVNHWHALEALYRKPYDCRRIAMNASITFDASVQQWVQVLSGCTVFVIPQALRLDPQKLLVFLEKNGIEAIDCTPSQLQAWIAAGLLERVKSLRTVLVGGEAVDQDLWRKLSQHPDVTFYNVYGPTECTVDSTAAHFSAASELPHIGRPMSNTQAYVLDPLQQVVPIGVNGEIFIGGSGVARGYIGRPELTAERFIAASFTEGVGARMYKSGDVGRWRTDGTIEYLGRNDFQVKIRGFRIELGEIEAQILLEPRVKRAAVIAREDVPGERRLVAYVVPKDLADVGGPLIGELLRKRLNSALPDYMIPAAFVILPEFPTTASGKLNRRALPTPEFSAAAGLRQELPQGEIETSLAQLWQDLLHVPQVGRREDFFALGGHSLLALRMLFKVNERFGSTLNAADAYSSPTICELAERIRGNVVADETVDIAREAVLPESIVALPGARSMAANSVLLTGANGFVGRFLLAQLLEDTRATVHCLVRAGSQQLATERLKKTLLKWGLWTDDVERRVVAISGDLGLPRLGLDPRAYDVLVQEVDTVYHCATSMNHLEPYAMAKPVNVEGARELLKFATTSKPKLVNYISTLSVFATADRDTIRAVSESTPCHTEQHPASHGYSASKCVSERLFVLASERGIPCNVFRLGLIWADTRQGRYDELQREYRIIKSSLLSGYGIRNYRYEMAPTPVDYVARSVVCLSDRHPNGGGMFHISSSTQKVDGVFERCNQIAGTYLELLSHYEWIARIKQLHARGKSLPIVPLVESLFSLSEESLRDYQRSTGLGGTRFDCEMTHRELEQAGIPTPALDDSILSATLRDMSSRDEELRSSRTFGETLQERAYREAGRA